MVEGTRLEIVQGRNPLESSNLSPSAIFRKGFLERFECEGGRGNISFPVAEILKPLGFRKLFSKKFC